MQKAVIIPMDLKDNQSSESYGGSSPSVEKRFGV